MVKISIELEAILEGEKLKDTLITKFKQIGLLLPERHVGLNLGDMPEIASLTTTDDKLELTIRHNNKSYSVLFPCKGHDILRATLSALYGYGNVRHNYDLPVFQVISEEDIAKYMELAVEIWERNIHREWMKKCGYETHNGTKDELFLQQMIADKSKAIETHRRRSHNREKGDTPHHIFSEPNIIRRIIEAQGDHELNKYLLESVYDKVTATTRYWYKLKKEQLQSCFEERLISNMNEGYYVNPEFRWKKGVFGFTNDYETRLWQLWLDVHYEFKEYWTKKFGQNEELWQPPAPLEVLKAKANI